MTTHARPDAAAPPDYPQHPPSTAYPTAPPWASPPEQQQAPAFTPAPPFAQHGQLIVPFPEEMHNAARPESPSWWPVAAWTAFFSFLGMVSGLAALAFGLTSALGIVFGVLAIGFGLVGIAAASRRANVARRGRNSVAPYWAAWAATMAVLSVVGGVVLAVGVPVYLAYREGVVTKVVESDLKNGDQLKESAGVTASSARCEPAGPRDAAGIRLYDCTLALDDGRTGSLQVTADSKGHWAAVPK
jgi:hypothetical protein